MAKSNNCGQNWPIILVYNMISDTWMSVTLLGYWPYFANQTWSSFQVVWRPVTYLPSILQVQYICSHVSLWTWNYFWWVYWDGSLLEYTQWHLWLSPCLLILYTPTSGDTGCWSMNSCLKSTWIQSKFKIL